MRLREGPGKGRPVGRRPDRAVLQMLLKHPIDAGRYGHGRRPADPQRQRPGRPSTGRVAMAPSAWPAPLPDQVPADISREEYAANQARLQANRARAALDRSPAAAERPPEERDTVTRLWQRRLGRARYEADRAARRDHAADPEPRPVARHLEGEWEARRAAVQRLEEEARRALQRQPRVLTAAARAAIRQLATAIPAPWAARAAAAPDRTAIMRQVVERVAVAVRGISGRVRVRIDWAGGGGATGEATRSIATWSQPSAYPRRCGRVTALTAAGRPAAAIAERLHAAGVPAVRTGRGIGARAVRALHHRLGLARRGPRRVPRAGLGEHEWRPAELVRRLAISRSSLYNGIKRGRVRARRPDDGCHRWVMWAGAAEPGRRRLLDQRAIAEEARRRWQGWPVIIDEARATGDE